MRWLLVLALGLCLARPATLQTADETAIILLDRAYTQRWKAGQADAVMDLFTDDAVVMPHLGEAPKVGKAALRAWWFPDGTPALDITHFDHRPMRVTVTGNMAMIYGRLSLSWVEDGMQTTITDGTYMLVAIRIDEAWKIHGYSYSDDPRRWLVERSN